MSPELRDGTNHCRLLLARRHKFESGGYNYSPTERVIGTQTGSVTTTPVASSKTASPQTKHKPKDRKTFSEENKQFDPGGRGGEPLPWKTSVPVFFLSWALLVLCAFLFVCLLCIVFIR